MRRLYTLARASQVAARLMNRVQDEQAGLIAASDQSSGATALLLTGADGRWWTTPDAGVPDAQLRVIDASIDWRSRRVWGVLRVLGAAARRAGQADDHIPNDPTGAVNARTFEGWTGAGGLGAAAATVANGTPPTIADNQYAVLLDEGATTADRVWLYARPSDGALCIYNDGGAALHAELLVWGSAVAPTPGATPSEYPAPVYVLWLTPSVAASRPATPDPAEQIALHRATDTGAITLWDSAAWRSLGIVSPLTTRGDVWVRDAFGDARLPLGTRGYVFRAGATDPAWGVVAASATSFPTASADYAGAVYWRSDLGAHYACTFGGLAAEWAWRVASIHDGAVAEDTTPGDTWTTIASTQIAEDSVALLDIEVAGVKSDLSAGMVAKGYAGFVNDGGTLALVEALTLLVGDPTRLQLTTAGPDVEVQVKGVVAEDWTWRVKITRRLEVEP